MSLFGFSGRAKVVVVPNYVTNQYPGNRQEHKQTQNAEFNAVGVNRLRQVNRVMMFPNEPLPSRKQVVKDVNAGWPDSFFVRATAAAPVSGYGYWDMVAAQNRGQ